MTASGVREAADIQDAFTHDCFLVVQSDRQYRSRFMLISQFEIGIEEDANHSRNVQQGCRS
jgi:hypothetical protein